MKPPLDIELGSRVLCDLHQENTGKPKWRVMAIVLRWYSQFGRERS